MITGQAMHYRFILFILVFILLGCDQGIKPSRTFTHSGLGIVAAAISKNSEQALVSTVDLGVQFWDLQANKLKFKLKHHGYDQDILAIALAKDSPIAVSLSANAMAVWDTKTGQAYRYLEIKEKPTSLALSKTGKYALIGFTDYSAQLIDVVNGNILRNFKHADTVTTVELSDDNKLAMIGSDDTAVRIWELNTGNMLYQWFHPSKVNHIKSSPNNQYLLNASSQSKAWIHDLKTGKIVSELQLAPKYNIFRILPSSITASLFTNDSKTIITGHPPRSIKIWDVQTGHLKKEITISSRSYWRPGASVTLALGLNEHEKILTAETSNGLAYQFILEDIL